MLTSLLLEEWKSFAPSDTGANRLQFSPVTLLVGPNASGKSNVLDALRFLQGAALDYPLGDVLRGRWEGQRETWTPVRGQVVEAARAGRSSFTLRSGWTLEGQSIEHLVRVDTSGDVALDEEGLFTTDGGYYYHTHAKPLKGGGGRIDGGGIRVAAWAAGKGNSAAYTYSSLRLLLSQLEVKGRVRPNVGHIVQLVRTALREATFLDIRPSLMRDYRPANGGHLGVAGENISPVLESLGREGDRLQDIVDWLSELCAPDLEGIEFDHTQLREVMMFLVERGGAKISARSMSDGTLRFLGELTALLTCPPGSLMIMEEPDVGLHPSRVHLLAELLESQAAQRKIQILATTHSPSLLAHLSEETLGNVIAFGRSQDDGTTVCARLRDLPNFDKLRDAEALERLVSTGWLERAL